MKEKNIHQIVLPSAIDMEEAVLGSLLLKSPLVDIVQKYLIETDFYDIQHTLIYRAIISLDKDTRPINLVSVMNRLAETNDLEKAGGPSKLSDLSTKVASTAEVNVEHYTLVVLEKAVAREAILSLNEASNSAFENEDIYDVLTWIGQEMQRLQEKLIGKKDTMHVSKATKDSVEQMHERISLFKKGRPAGVPYGLKYPDRHLGGWQNSELNVIAARPGMGKTAFALHFAKEAAMNGFPVAIFTLEMSGRSLTDRLLLSQSGVDADNFRMGKMEKEEVAKVEIAANDICGLKIYIDDNPDSSMSYIRSKARLLHKKEQCSMLIIDYLQLVSSDSRYNIAREQQVAQMSRNAKMIAKELDIPVLLLSQLNRKVEAREVKKPLISDLRESGAIEQDADKVYLIHRPEYYGEKLLKEDGSEVERGISFDLAKNRSGGTMNFIVQHDGTLNRIFDIGADPKMPF